MCILAGCDYVPSMHGMGPKTAHAMLRKYKDIDKVLSKQGVSGLNGY